MRFTFRTTKLAAACAALFILAGCGGGATEYAFGDALRVRVEKVGGEGERSLYTLTGRVRARCADHEAKVALVLDRGWPFALSLKEKQRPRESCDT